VTETPFGDRANALQQECDVYLKQRWEETPLEAKYALDLTRFGWANHPMIHQWKIDFFYKKLLTLLKDEK